MEAVDKMVQEGLPQIEAIMPDVGSTKWLMGTDELTLLDINCGAMYDSAYVNINAPANAEAAARADLQNNAPKWCAYIERLRAHPKIAPVCMIQEVSNKQ